MALEEVSFYNVNGDEINITNLVEQMINYYDLTFINKIKSGSRHATAFDV